MSALQLYQFCFQSIQVVVGEQTYPRFHEHELSRQPHIDHACLGQVHNAAIKSCVPLTLNSGHAEAYYCVSNTNKVDELTKIFLHARVTCVNTNA